MSGIAEVLATQGYQVSGSDLAASAVTKRLAGLGVRIAIGHDAAHVASADAVVVSTAVAADNPEVAAARGRGIPVVPRALMLAELMRLKHGHRRRGHARQDDDDEPDRLGAGRRRARSDVRDRRPPALGGHATRGSATVISWWPRPTSRMRRSSTCRRRSPSSPTSTPTTWRRTATTSRGSSARSSTSCSGCRSTASRCCASMTPTSAKSCRRSRSRSSPTASPTDARLRAIDVDHAGRRMRFVARDVQAARPAGRAQRCPACTTCRNALAAIAIGREVGVADAAIANALSEFRGVGRRFQRCGDVAIAGGGAYTLIDDYGHHPVEMAATIDAARGSFPGRRLVLAFQPHRYTRTRDLFEDFVARAVDRRRARADGRLSRGRAADRRRRRPRAGAGGARRGPGRAGVRREARRRRSGASRAIARDGDVVVTMGAGSIGQVAFAAHAA